MWSWLWKLPLTLAVAAGVVGSWTLIESMPYSEREQLLNWFTIALLPYPFILLALPKRFRASTLIVPCLALLLSIRWSSDMGYDGHFLTAGFLGMASLWALIPGAIIVICPPKPGLR